MLDHLPAGDPIGLRRRSSRTAMAVATGILMFLVIGVTVVTATGSPVTPNSVLLSEKVGSPLAQDPVPGAGIRPTGPPGDWKLAFHDEFTGTSLDTTKWIPCVSAGWRAADRRECLAWSSESQRYTRQNVTVSQGAAHLVAQKEPDGSFTSGAITTAEDAFGFDQAGYQPFGYKYGYFEARIRTPDQPGMWPAVWSMPVGGGGKGEMDLYELMAGPEDPERISMSLHGDSAPEIVGQAHPQIPDIADTYHVFGAEWTADHLTYWVDGHAIRTITEEIPQAAHFLMANLAIGGQVGPPDPEQRWPLTMDIDYMRVFQQT